MSNILLAAPMLDEQTGLYIYDTLIQMGNKVAFFDYREIGRKEGIPKMNKMFVDISTKLKPELTIILKGIGLTGETIKTIKDNHDHKIVGWIFDVTLGGTIVKDVKPYVDMIKELDTFYTVDQDAIPDLTNLGVNAKYLTEGCFLPAHEEQIFNFIQAKKYGADIVFLGTVGGLHKNRAKFLKRIYDEGFNFKIYGNVEYPKGEDPVWVKDTHTGYGAINDKHSLVCGASKIVIGLDGWNTRTKAYSARLFRVLCAGGFYLTLHTKDIEEEFELGTHFDTFKDEDEMIEKIIKYLQDDELREKIAKEGQKLVIDKHQFKHKLEQIVNDANLKNDNFIY